VFLVAGTVSVFVMPMMGRLAPKVDGRILLTIGVLVVAYAAQLLWLLWTRHRGMP